MNIDQKLAAIRDVIQQDVGNRGLARDPHDNLITACPDDFSNACRSIAERRDASIMILTGFFIPFADQHGAYETDGPLGAVYLASAFGYIAIPTFLFGDIDCVRAMHAGGTAAGAPVPAFDEILYFSFDGSIVGLACGGAWKNGQFCGSHFLAIEHPGPAADSKSYTMRGYDVSTRTIARTWFSADPHPGVTIGIGDGGNEIGMGKIPHETIVNNIPNGDLIHCRVSTDHLIVAGVSNWGAYALSAGVALLRGVELPEQLFNPNRERAILQVMVEAGPLVDGVSGKRTATVDGLSWDDYIRPLVEIGRIVKG